MRKKLLLQTYSNVIIRDYSLLFLFKKCCFNEKTRLNSDVLLLQREVKSNNKVIYNFFRNLCQKITENLLRSFKKHALQMKQHIFKPCHSIERAPLKGVTVH